MLSRAAWEDWNFPRTEVSVAELTVPGSTRTPATIGTSCIPAGDAGSHCASEPTERSRGHVLAAGPGTTPGQTLPRASHTAPPTTLGSQHATSTFKMQKWMLGMRRNPGCVGRRGPSRETCTWTLWMRPCLEQRSSWISPY